MKKCLIIFLSILFFSQTNFLLAQEGKNAISGNIITSDGKAAVNVTVKIEGTDLQKQTDTKGLFRFEGLNDGNYTIIVITPGYADVKRTSSYKEVKRIMKVYG